MKIIQTKKFIESGGGHSGDYENQKSIWGPKNHGPMNNIFDEKSDSEDDIISLWKKKKKKVKIKRPYQTDGVPGSTL